MGAALFGETEDHPPSGRCQQQPAQRFRPSHRSAEWRQEPLDGQSDLLFGTFNVKDP